MFRNVLRLSPQNMFVLIDNFSKKRDPKNGYFCSKTIEDKTNNFVGISKEFRLYFLTPMLYIYKKNCMLSKQKNDFPISPLSFKATKTLCTKIGRISSKSTLNDTRYTNLSFYLKHRSYNPKFVFGRIPPSFF